MSTTTTIPEATALALESLITPTAHGIASRILSKTNGGSLTLFAFDTGQGLSEHTAPFDALVIVLEGRLLLTIGGVEVTATPGTVVRMPGGERPAEARRRGTARWRRAGPAPMTTTSGRVVVWTPRIAGILVGLFI